MQSQRHFFNSYSDDTRRQELIARIERAIAGMTLQELEALSYDMFTKGYLDE
ncbi:MAG: hypothetical protein U0I89_03570 [Prevotella sp.]|jgi:hypothetical protein|nr:hypothetical protein [Prevotella sp.]MEE0336358.1 hypothetical protein [Prevotella sp.]